ncbi:hypothetical protein Rhe02_07830 [Rhizocola hellebori]|uniref:Uncharacterized protein n=1 Tax=Rhizocola hellebori TaxID=1392758 RepID=A0A8J3Q306_9ACTN|nr:hypothetical protein [Rhizocola hellebori]GIH02716.1 hypothetical protein Rhe02_07830 [Rhizocola hellebori]
MQAKVVGDRANEGEVPIVKARSLIRRVARRLVAVGAVALLCVAVSARAAEAAPSVNNADLVAQIKLASGKLLAKSVQPKAATTASGAPLTITCYVDDVTPPFRIFGNVAYRSVIGCDAPVVGAWYGEILRRLFGPEKYLTTGTLAGPLTVWTPFNPVVGPCISDWWEGSFTISVDFTPSFSLTQSFVAPYEYIECI